ncbi:RHS repeat-associated core domain-containing protein [Streptomyces sp. Y7]|uniref:RHS repeat-associated core domain-containing protein n=1 Tax=Streptomyces sp. Y7 TaxID=3342392 RepID=UPI0037240D6F
MAHSELTATADGYQLKTPEGRVVSFDQEGRLTQSTDKQGRVVLYGRDAAGLVSSVTSPSGQKAEFTYTNSQLANISLSDGRRVSYAYTGGRLSQVTQPDGNRVNYRYDSAGRISAVIDQRGNAAVANVYDATGRVKEQTDALGNKTQFAYRGVETDVTAPDGGIWTDVYNQNVLLAQYDPFGNKTSYGYTYRLDPIEVTDALGNKINREVDGAGRLKEIKTALSSRSWTYNTSGNIFLYTNGNTKRSSYSYDAKSQLSAATNALGKKIAFTHTDRGQLETVTDPRGKITKYGYDTAGNRTSQTFPDGARQTWGYDAAGRVTSSTEPRGNLSGANSADFTTNFTYDDAGRRTSTKDTNGNTTRNEYDAAGNLTSETNAAGKVTSFVHDAANRLTEVKDATGRVAKVTYDVMGNVASRTDTSGAKTAYTYDKAGRVLTMTTPRGNIAGADAAKYTWKYGYDKVGNQITVTDPAGSTTKTDYNAEYRPIASTDPLGRVRKTEYDREGNVTKATDSLGKTTSHTYDANNQLLTTTDRGSKPVTYTYDDAGNLSSTTSPLGNKTTYAYDDNGRLTTTVEPRGNIAGADPAQYTWSSAYDAAGNVLSQTDPYGRKTFTSAYDGDGRVVERTDALGKKTAYEHDALGRLTKVTAPDGGITSLDYDALGNLTSRKDANGHTANFGYDEASRLTKVTDPLGRATSYGYDADGNRTTITNARGQKVANTYDARNLLTTATFSDGTPTVSYTYDAAGQPKTIKDGTGTRTVTYDDEGRPLSITSPGATNPFKYTYNDNGTVKSRTYPDGRAITYAYDSDSQIVGQTAGGKTTSYTWDAAGNRTSTKLPTTTPITEARTYDRAGRLTSVSEGTGARNLERDAAGRVIKDYFKDSATTGLADRYAYDAVGRMTRACTDTSSTTSCLTGSSGSTYAYDKVGNLATSSTSTSTRTNTYDAADQLTKRVEGTTTVDFTYDADGNLTKDAAGTYIYDPLSRLKTATLGSDAYAFVNDADGNRTTTNKNGALSRTSRWDIVNPLPQIATETNSTGALIADYQYNPEGVAESQNRTSGTFYMRHDRQNSINAVYDASGKETYTYTYTAWGVSSGKESTADGQSSIFGYTGQYKDPILSGRLYLRERSYDPGNRRFTTPDPEPAANDSPNPTPYAYANNDPINQSDPSGRCPLCISVGIGAAIGTAVEGGIYSWQHRNGGFTWGGLAKAGAQGAATGAVAGALMPGAGHVAARSLGLSGGRGLAASTAVNSAVGAGFSWGLNEVHCRPTTPWDLVIGAAGGGSSSLIGPAFSWLKNRLFAPTVTVSAHTNRLSGYAYRGLRADEDPSQGLRAAGTNPDVQAWQHVVQDNDSPWISLSRDPNVAWKYSGQGQKTIVAVDLSKLGSETIDAAANLRVPHEFYNFAKDAAWRDKEILVKFTVPAEAIVMRWPAGTDFDQILRDISEVN